MSLNTLARATRLRASSKDELPRCVGGVVPTYGF